MFFEGSLEGTRLQDIRLQINAAEYPEVFSWQLYKQCKATKSRKVVWAVSTMECIPRYSLEV